MNEPRGLYQKYYVEKVDGTPIAPGADYLVLRLDDGEYVGACRYAALTFAEGVKAENPILARDIRLKVLGYFNPMAALERQLEALREVRVRASAAYNYWAGRDDALGERMAELREALEESKVAAPYGEKAGGDG